jgi:hypothetical protein
MYLLHDGHCVDEDDEHDEDGFDEDVDVDGVSDRSDFFDLDDDSSVGEGVSDRLDTTGLAGLACTETYASIEKTDQQITFMQTCQSHAKSISHRHVGCTKN